MALLGVEREGEGGCGYRVHLGWVSLPETGPRCTKSFGSFKNQRVTASGMSQLLLHGCHKTHLGPPGGDNLDRAWAVSGKRC